MPCITSIVKRWVSSAPRAASTTAADAAALSSRTSPNATHCSSAQRAEQRADAVAMRDDPRAGRDRLRRAAAIAPRSAPGSQVEVDQRRHRQVGALRRRARASARACGASRFRAPPRPTSTPGADRTAREQRVELRRRRPAPRPRSAPRSRCSSTPAVLASARPAAATSMIEKLMIAITHGVGPRSRAVAEQPPLGRRGEEPAEHQAVAPRRARRIAQRAGRIDQRAVLEPDQLRARRRADQADVVGRDDDRRAEPVERGEQVQQALGHVGIDVAGRLVGDEQLGPVDHRAGDRDALLLAARQRRRPGAGAVGEPDPGEHLAHRALRPPPRSRRRCAAAARHCRTRTGGGSGGSPGTRRRSGGGTAAARRAAPRSAPRRTAGSGPRVGRCAR